MKVLPQELTSGASYTKLGHKIPENKCKLREEPTAPPHISKFPQTLVGNLSGACIFTLSPHSPVMCLI